MLDITQIPAPRIPLIDERTGLLSRQWYRFFYNIYVLTGGGSNAITLEELQLGPPNQPDFTEILKQVNNNISPEYQDQSGNFLATLDAAQLMAVMARFENAEAAIQGAYLQPVVQTGTIASYNLDSSPTAGGVAYGTGPALAVSAAGTVGQVLTSAGAGTPTWAAAATGTVTSVSVVSANGLAGTVATATTTPAITLSTTITGLLKGNGTAISAATSGTDYAPATSGTSILYGNGAGGFSNVTIGTGVAFSAGTLSATGSGGTVTSVGFTGGIITVANPTTTPAFTIAGTSGGIPYFSNGTTWASSATLAAGALVLGGGAGVTPATTTTGTGVVTALGVNTGTAGAFVVNGGALGTPSSGIVTNLTGTASININGTVGDTTPTTVAATTVIATGGISGHAASRAVLDYASSTARVWGYGVNDSTIGEVQIQVRSSAGTLGNTAATFTSTGINSAAIGATTPSTGAFTTLAASSTVSGAGFTAYFASPPAIGGTAAAAGSFTTLSASAQIAGNNTASYQAIFKGWGPLESDSTAGAIVVGGSSQNSGRGEIHYWNNSSPAPALYIDNTRNAVAGKIVFRLRTSGTAIEAGSFTTTGLTTAGTISPQQATTAGAPDYVKGAMYFDTTLNKLRIGGATAWETVTSV